jgi:hypothetical protein
MTNHIARQVACMKITSVADCVDTKLACDRYRNVTGQPNTNSRGKLVQSRVGLSGLKV